MDFSDFERRLIRVANQGQLRASFLREVSRLLIESSNCDELELRATDRELRYRWCAGADSPGRLEIVEFVNGDDNRPLPCLPGDSDLEALCRSLFNPRGEPELHLTGTPRPLYLPNLAERIILKRPSREITGLRERLGFAALLLLPFEVHDGSRGLLILKSRRPSFLHTDDVARFEDLMRTFSIAVDFRRSQAALKERIKELTCLYEINQLFQEPESDTGELLQKIVECIPPAFQYPWLTHCRIVLGRNDYHSSRFVATANSLATTLQTGGRNRGRIEVFYENDPLLGEPAHFLVEEKRLLELIGQKIGMMLDNLEVQAERRRIEEQLRHADRLATIGQLAAGFAHELNNPLANILGFAQLLTKSIPEGPVNEDLQRIVRSSLQAREIVRKLLLFGRQAPTNLTEADLDQVVTDTLDLLSSRIEKEGVTLVRRRSETPPMLKADLAQLTQVVMNLAVNALQAMPAGGVLTVVTRVTRTHVVLSVEDTGTGMSEEVRRQVFLPFFTTKRVGEGTGLGLSVVHGIITAHGGTIRVSSKSGKGSRFTVNLPAAIRSKQ
jgi:signal transduction histidine kinase